MFCSFLSFFVTAIAKCDIHYLGHRNEVNFPSCILFYALSWSTVLFHLLLFFLFCLFQLIIDFVSHKKSHIIHILSEWKREIERKREGNGQRRGTKAGVRWSCIMPQYHRNEAVSNGGTNANDSYPSWVNTTFYSENIYRDIFGQRRWQRFDHFMCTIIWWFQFYIVAFQIGLIFVFNLIVGTGALTLPSAFAKTGWLLGFVLVIVLAFISYVTVTFVIEAMACANAISYWTRLQVMKRDCVSHLRQRTSNSSKSTN